MSFTFIKYGKGFLVKGYDKELAESFKDIGGRWNRGLKGWVFGSVKQPFLEDIGGVSGDEEKVEYSTDVEEFCKSLLEDYMNVSKKKFLNLDPSIQRIFLKFSSQILLQSEMYSDKSKYRAFKLFQLFNETELKKLSIFQEEYNSLLIQQAYLKISTELEKTIKENSIERSRSRSKSRSTKRLDKYDKEWQKAETPDEDSAIYIFYTSLYKQKPSSKLAITWLTENGVFDDEQRDKLVRKYVLLKNKRELRR